MPKFRPPKLPKDFPPNLGEAFRQLFDDIAGLLTRPGDVSVAGSTYRPVPGECKRVSPPAAGMGFVLPPPSAENRAQTITAIIEKPQGALRAFVSQDGPAGPSGRPSIDGDETRSYSTAGAVSFISNGVDKWSESRGPAGAAGATGATGASGTQSYHVDVVNFREHFQAPGGISDTTFVSATNIVELGAQSSVKDHPGICRYRAVSIQNTGAAILFHGHAAGTTAIDIDNVTKFRWVVRPTTSLGGAQYFIGWGVRSTNNGDATLGSAGVFFSYEPATSANWLTNTIAASTPTQKTTSVAVALTTWAVLEAEKVGTDWLFYIDGALVNTHTAAQNVPVTTMGYVEFQFRLTAADASNRELDIDELYYKVSLGLTGHAD